MGRARAVGSLPRRPGLTVFTYTAKPGMAKTPIARLLRIAWVSVGRIVEPGRSRSDRVQGHEAVYLAL